MGTPITTKNHRRSFLSNFLNALAEPLVIWMAAIGLLLAAPPELTQWPVIALMVAVGLRNFLTALGGVENIPAGPSLERPVSPRLIVGGPLTVFFVVVGLSAMMFVSVYTIDLLDSLFPDPRTGGLSPGQTALVVNGRFSKALAFDLWPQEATTPDPTPIPVGIGVRVIADIGGHRDYDGVVRRDTQGTDRYVRVLYLEGTYQGRSALMYRQDLRPSR